MHEACWHRTSDTRACKRRLTRPPLVYFKYSSKIIYIWGIMLLWICGQPLHNPLKGESQTMEYAQWAIRSSIISASTYEHQQIRSITLNAMKRDMNNSSRSKLKTQCPTNNATQANNLELLKLRKIWCVQQFVYVLFASVETCLRLSVLETYTYILF